MAYRIEYGPPFPKSKTKFPLRLIVLTASFFVLFLLATKIIWPTESKRLAQFLLPFRANTDFYLAIQTFVANLKSGTPIYQSLTAFCQEIISHADIPPV